MIHAECRMSGCQGEKMKTESKYRKRNLKKCYNTNINSPPVYRHCNFAPCSVCIYLFWYALEEVTEDSVMY